MAKIWQDGEFVTVYSVLSGEVKALEKEAKALAEDERHIGRGQVIKLAERVGLERAAGNITGIQHMRLDSRLHALWPDS